MVNPIIQPEEYDKRLSSIRAAMQAEGIDLFMAFSNLLDPSSVRYFTDFSAVNESSAVIFTQKRATLCSA